jgi:hypothetical protein
MKQSGSCQCGASKFEVDGASLGRFFCHCTICQSLYKQPFADVTAFRARDVKLSPDSKVEFKRLRAPPAVNRGICPQCGRPVVGYMALLPGVRVGFAPSANLPVARELPAAFAHIFYQSRIADIPDAIPKVSGYWRSEWAVGRHLLGALLG